MKGVPEKKNMKEAGRYVKGDTKSFSRHYFRGEYNVENLKLSRDHNRKNNFIYSFFNKHI